MIKKFDEFVNEEKLHYAADTKFDIKSVEYNKNNGGEVVVKFPDKEVTGEFRISPYGKITFQHWFPKSVFYALIKMVTDKCEDEDTCAKIKKYTKKVNESYYEMNYNGINEESKYLNELKIQQIIISKLEELEYDDVFMNYLNEKLELNFSHNLHDAFQFTINIKKS